MQTIKTPRTVLVDARNYQELLPKLLEEIENSEKNGFDLETFDRPHEKLAAYRKEKRKLVFDINRTKITGFSIYCSGSEVAYYFNTYHSDVSNRLSLEEITPLLDLMTREDKLIICHNSVFELTMTKTVWDYDLAKNDNVVCTMIQAVTAYNPDEYRLEDFQEQRLKPMNPLVKEIREAFAPDKAGEYPKFNLNEKQRKLIGQVVGKTSSSAFSYNGMVNNITHSYGLKKMVKSFFGHKMATFKETLAAGEADDMGDLTGEQTASYGADDAFWAVKIYDHLFQYMLEGNPKALQAFFSQENPMAQHYSQMWVNGMLIDQASLADSILRERKAMAAILRELKVTIKGALPFPTDPNEAMLKHNKIYKNNHGKYRQALIDFSNLADVDDDYLMCRQVLIKTLTKLSGVEQRMSLYLTPYSGLINPTTGKVHPVVSSELATRRLAMKDPNGMQLAKFGDSGYIRGFYLPDEPEHVIISLDWSQVELVLIGEMSGDPEFYKCYSQVPYLDLHSVAAAPLAAKMDGVPEYTLEQFNALPKETKKKHRNALGKGSNFEYWYSGGLWTLATKMKLSFDDAKELAARYAEKFHVAEAWRRGVIQEAAIQGYVELPDGTRRVRFESTAQWKNLMMSFFGPDPRMKAFGEQVVRKIQKRSGNQAVNAMIQGSCATLAKRSADRIVKECAKLGLRVRFMMPIHDELVWSVHKDDVQAFLKVARACMTDHPDIFSNLVLDCTASIGNTFRPYNKDEAPYGQIEVDELPAEFCITTEKDGRATEDEIQAIIDYLMKGKAA